MTATTVEFLDRDPSGPRRSRGDRRTRARLRELCEEVLASYRVARGKDVLTDEDRRAADELLARMGPTVRVKR